MSKGFVPKSKLLKRDALTGFLFSLPSIIGMLVFFLIPFVICIILSLTDSISSMKFVGIDNYVDIISSRTFRLAVWNTFKFIIVAVPLIMIFSLTIAMLLYQILSPLSFTLQQKTATPKSHQNSIWCDCPFPIYKILHIPLRQLFVRTLHIMCTSNVMLRSKCIINS